MNGAKVELHAILFFQHGTVCVLRLLLHYFYHTNIDGTSGTLALEGQRLPGLDFNSRRELLVVVFGHVVPNRLSSSAHAEFVGPHERIGEGNADVSSTNLVRHEAGASSKCVVLFIAQEVPNFTLPHR